MSNTPTEELFGKMWELNGLSEEYKSIKLFVGKIEKLHNVFTIIEIRHILKLGTLIVNPIDNTPLRIALSEEIYKKYDTIVENQTVIFSMCIYEKHGQLKFSVNLDAYLHICKENVPDNELIKYILKEGIFKRKHNHLKKYVEDEKWLKAFNRAEFFMKTNTIEELDNIIKEKKGTIKELENRLKPLREEEEKCNTIEELDNIINEKEQTIEQLENRLKPLHEEEENCINSIFGYSKQKEELENYILELNRRIRERSEKYMEENLKDFSIYEGNIDFSGFYNRLCAEYRKEFGDDLFLNSSDIVDYKGVAFQFLMALNTDQIITMCGEPGYGKTTFVSMMAKALGAKLTFVEVQNNWADLTDILGLYNPIDQTYHSTNFLDALLDASTEYEALGENSRIHFICLDEMNLAKVEYYFSFFLSLLPRINRSQNRFPVINLLPKYLLTEIDEIKDRYNGQTEIMTDSEKKVLQLERFKDFRFPPNVRFVATMNVDETTEDLSPKVVDRCVFIEVPGNKREDMNVVTENEDLQLGEKQEYIPAKFFDIGHNDFYSVNDKTELFAKVNFRAQTFINRMFDFFMEYCNGFTEDWFWDYITLCKLLPKCSTIDEYDSIVGENGKYKDLYICAAKKFSDPKCKLSSKEWNYWGKR